MQDLLYVGVAFAFFSVTGLLVKLCAALSGDKQGGRS
jgi:hypothetical protein